MIRTGKKTSLSRRETGKQGMFYLNRQFDMPFAILVLLLLVTGLIMMFSASYAVAYYDEENPLFYIERQIIFAIAGVVLMFFISTINYNQLRRFPLIALVGSFILTAMVFTPLGVTRNNATRWLNLGVQFQPSELLKFGVILAFAAIGTKYQDKMEKQGLKYGIIPLGIILGPIVLLLKKQPHISAAMIIAVTAVVMIFVSGLHWKWFAMVVAVGIPAVVVIILSKPYIMERIAVWIDPFIDPQNKGWQGAQSFMAIGSGGFWGLGIGQSRQKHLYLPEPANDFIFSVICEELGFAGAVLIVIAFAAFIVRGYWIAARIPDTFGKLLTVGITTQIAIQTVINMWVVTGLMPITGASLPFFSYGGTSLLILLCEVGVILGVSRHIPVVKQG